MNPTFASAFEVACILTALALIAREIFDNREAIVAALRGKD